MMLDVNTKLLAHGALYLRDHQNGLDPLLAELIADEIEKVVEEVKTTEVKPEFDASDLGPRVVSPFASLPDHWIPVTPTNKQSRAWKLAMGKKNRAAMKWARGLAKPFTVDMINARTSGPTIIYEWVHRGLAKRVAPKQFVMNPVSE